MEVLSTPIKSENDKKNYRLIKLENGLKALLISKTDDEEGKTVAAASLCVYVGSYENPPNVLGLAHFFEHMIFLDYGNYENNIKEYVEGHNGYCNAMTGNDFTNYELKINDKHFPEALKRFSELITSPKLNKNLMQSERINVDSEYRISKQNPMTRRSHLHRLYLNQEHPASRFPVGNLQTLKENISDDDLHHELVKFNNNYVANKMTLCVQSNRPMDEIQKLVVDNFSKIKKNDGIKFQYEEPVDFDVLIKPEFYSKVLYLKDTNESTMALTWVLPPIHKNYKSKPIDILERIFYNNDEGGLVQYLKEKNYITDMSLTDRTWFASAQFIFLRLELELTDLGFELINDILSAIYSYLLMLKNTPRAEYSRLFYDVQEDINLRFKFQRESQPLSNVEIAREMRFFNDEDMVRGKYVLLKYDEDALIDLIDRLNTGKFNITFLTKKRDGFPLKEDIYDLEYDEIDMSVQYTTLWNERKENPKFFIEQPNPYKIQNFDIYTDDEELDHPEKIFKNEMIEIWHMLDRKFKQPFANIEMMLIGKDYGKSSETYTYMRLLSKIISDIFDKEFSKSHKVGYSNSFYVSYDSMQFSFGGYNDKMLKIVDATFEEFKKIVDNVDESRFIKKIDEYKKSLMDSLYDSRAIGSNELSKILSNSYFTNFDVLKILDNISFDKFNNSIKDTLKQLKVVTLVQGNIKKEDALKIAELFQKYFDCEKLDEANHFRARGFQVPLGSHTLRMKSTHPTDDLSIIMNYYQAGPYTIHTQNLASMLSSFLDPKAFDFLRTKLQLSYNVSFSMSKLDKVIGFKLAVRSNEDVNNYIKIYEKMEEFINVLCKQYVADMTDEEFEANKKGRISGLSQPNLTLSTEITLNLREITEEAYNFNRTKEAIEDAERITKHDLQNYFKSVFDSQNIRKIMIQVIGKTKFEILNDVPDDNPKRIILTEKTEIDENIIADINEFKKMMFLYPVCFN
ncbi:hypothetical protein ACKWTF_007199 [Chironomus riparius]